MKNCKNCGVELADDVTVCTSCGTEQKTSLIDKAKALVAEVMEAGKADAMNYLWLALGFLVWPAGLILYFVWKENEPVKAKCAITGVLAAVIVGVVMGILGAILGVLIAVLAVGIPAIMSNFM